MKKMMSAAALLLIAGAISVQAQARSSTRIRISKEGPTTTSSASGVVDTTMVTTTTPMDTTITTTYGYYLPTPAAHCSTLDPSSLAVQIKTDLYDPATMISPDSAKAIALCAVPGQIGSGEMNVANGITHYAIDIIPNHKKTHAKVLVDAQTGAVLSSKQFGGLRGLAGWVRESKEHKTNAAKAAKDTIPY